MNRPCLLHGILADETHAEAAEHYALAAEEQTHAEAEGSARALSLADAVMAAAPPAARSAAGFAEVESAGNSAEATAHPALPAAHSGGGSPEAEPVGNSDVTIPACCAECCFPAAHKGRSNVAAPVDYSSAAVPGRDPVWLTADAAHCACRDPASPDDCCPAAAGSHRGYSADLLDSLSPVRVEKFLPAAVRARFAALLDAGRSSPAGSLDCCSPAH